MEKLLKEILGDEKFKELLRDYLAQKVSEEYHFQDSEGELIKKEIREIIKNEANDIVNDFDKHYYEMKDIKQLISEEIRKLSKVEILDLLVTTIKIRN